MYNANHPRGSVLKRGAHYMWQNTVSPAHVAAASHSDWKVSLDVGKSCLNNWEVVKCASNGKKW